MTKQLNKKGTSLVELIAVIIIMGSIAGVAIPTTIAVINRQKKNAAVNSAKNVMAAAEPVLLEKMATPTATIAGVNAKGSGDPDDCVYKITVADLATNGHLKENPLENGSNADTTTFIYVTANNKCKWSAASITINGVTINTNTLEATDTTTAA